MAGEIIRPKDLPPKSDINPNARIAADDETRVWGPTIAEAVGQARPFATQPQAAAGTSTTATMNPLTTKQSIASEVGVSIASKAQGDLASTAVQPGELATVATTGVYADLSGRPALGTAAATDASAYAVAAQGVKADTAVQPADLAPVAVSGDYNDLINKPAGLVPGDGTVTFPKLADALVQKDTEPRDDTADNVLPTVKRVATMIGGASVLSPESFGCVGDGVTDDSANYLSALTEASTSGRTLVHTPGKTYLLNTWAPLGFFTNGVVRMQGFGAASKIKGPAAGAYFLRPGSRFDIDGLDFDRWTGVVRRDIADGGEIIGAHFSNNVCQNITGISFNIERPFKDSFISRNRFDGCSGGYVIRVGENTNANQDTWAGYFVLNNVMRNLTAPGTTSGFPIICAGRDALIDGNDIDGLVSTNGEAVAIYVKLRYSQVSNNRIRNITSTGSTGTALDVAGISLKGAIRSVTNSGINGYKVQCIGNQIRNIGTQGVKGTGIRCQIAEGIVQSNIVQDCGLAFISADDSNGTSYNKIIDNHCDSFNMLPTFGIYLSTFGTGHIIKGNTVKDALRGIIVEVTSNTLLSTLVEGNMVNSTVPGSSAFLLSGAASIAGVLITGNHVNVPSNGIVVQNNTTSAVARVNVRNNDFTPAISAGAALSSGSVTGITFASNP